MLEKNLTIHPRGENRSFDILRNENPSCETIAYGVQPCFESTGLHPVVEVMLNYRHSDSGAKESTIIR
jgi:hypothetical protein